MVLDSVNLRCYMNIIVWRQNSCYGLVAGLSFHNSLEGMIELCEDGDV